MPVKVGEIERTTDPEPVDEVTPVPPLPTAKVPATVTSPLESVEGVSPVEPKLIRVDGEAAAEVHVVPSEVRMFPLEPGATPSRALVPLPKRT